MDMLSYFHDFEEETSVSDRLLGLLYKLLIQYIARTKPTIYCFLFAVESLQMNEVLLIHWKLLRFTDTSCSFSEICSHKFKIWCIQHLWHVKLAVNGNCWGVREFKLQTQISCLTGINSHSLLVNNTKDTNPTDHYVVAICKPGDEV